MNSYNKQNNKQDIIQNQNIISKQNNIDYFKELNDIYKEIEKIYNQLSKNEDFLVIIENIKTNFINNNISIIEDNLSNTKLTNYASFDTKIIKILKILIQMLENFSNIKKENLKKNKENVLKFLKLFDNKEERQEPTSLSNNIDDILTKTDKYDDYAHIDSDSEEKKKEKTIKKEKYDQVQLIQDINGDDIYIYKYIYTFEYYLDIFVNKNLYYDEIDNQIKEKEKEIKTPPLTQANLKEKEKFKIELNNLHDINKKKYKELLIYIKFESFNIFEIVIKYIKSFENNENNEKKEKKDKNDILKEFKTQIYYETINIDNTQINDNNAKRKENSNEKIDLESRKKLLGEMKVLLDKQLNKLYNIINYLITSDKQEYSEEIVKINNFFKYKSYKEKEYKDPIIILIVNEETEIANLLEKNKNEKILLDNTRQTGDRDRDREERERRERRNNNYRQQYDGDEPAFGGGEKKSSKYYEDKYDDLKKFNETIKKFTTIIKSNEGIEDTEDPFEKTNKMLFGDTDKGLSSIYKNIWNDYIKGTQKNKAKGSTIETLKQDNRLYERFKEGELDPTEILKITFQDKSIFVCIILILRTISMVLIEFLIEYNVIGSLYRGIVIYSVIYIFLLICCVLLINYDSYKLRILVNYLNLHINSSNMFFHILLFILLIGLILIIINNNDINSMDIDNILTYTYIYKYIYEIAEKSKNIYENPETITTTNYLILSQKEKMKLRYRLDIITMIIFIFSSLLIFVM